MEVDYRDPKLANGVSDAEVESVMEMLMAHQRARAEGVGQPNPQRYVNSLLKSSPYPNYSMRSNNLLNMVCITY